MRQGLVAAGEHPSPIDYAHFTTTSTYKQLFGPRGGLILIGKEANTLSPDKNRTLPEMIQKAVFPFFQGTPNLGSIAAKARALAIVASPEFKILANRIIANAKALAQCLADKGYMIVTKGTDNHIVLVNVLQSNITGTVAERALEDCGIIVNKNRIPGDKKAAMIASGIRLGTNSLAFRGLGPNEMSDCADLIHRVLQSIKMLNDYDYEIDRRTIETVSNDVSQMCKAFPLPTYRLP